MFGSLVRMVIEEIRKEGEGIKPDGFIVHFLCLYKENEPKESTPNCIKTVFSKLENLKSQAHPRTKSREILKRFSSLRPTNFNSIWGNNSLKIGFANLKTNLKQVA